MLDITVEGLGLQCIYVTTLSDGDLPAQERDFLASMRDMTRGKPLRGFSSDWTYLKQQLIEPAPVYNDTDGYSGMVKIVGTQSRGDKLTTYFEFKVRGVEIEGDSSQFGVDVQFPWEDRPRRDHNKWVSVQNFFIDTFPVTQAQYAEYV